MFLPPRDLVDTIEDIDYEPASTAGRDQKASPSVDRTAGNEKRLYMIMWC